MFSKHVSSLTSAYCHDELSPEQSRPVAEHLIGCPRCRAEFEEIKFGVKLATQLPLMSAPDSVWRGIETALDREVLKSPTREGWRIMPFLMQPRFALPALASVVLVVAAFGAYWMMQHTPALPGTTSAWDVARLDGMPRIGSDVISDKGKLAVGQWLVTDGSSRAKIDVSSIGHVEIDRDTRVRLLETNPKEHRLELARGRLSARISAPPKLFFVNTPSAVAEDIGCAYTLEVDDKGGSLLRVTSGWVALHLQDRESVVPAGAACATRPGIGPGTPYFEDASQFFRQALTKLDFEPDDKGRSRTAALDIILREARPRDTMTLWHLLSRVSEKDRARVYRRMALLIPPPAGVTRDGVLRLDQDMLDRWRDLIDSQSRSETIGGIWEKIKGGSQVKGRALHGK
jgi:FecR-like protein/putative zinc finger protein